MRFRVLALSVIMLSAAFVFGSIPVKAEPTASPMISSSEILTTDKIKPGMTGYGLTVFRGTTPERFNISVIGVLHNIDFDADLILIRITSGPVVTRKWGIIAGMSGSPIYIGGKLVGALAFAWGFSKEPIAGITPIRQMVENYSPGSISFARKSSAAQPPMSEAVLLPRNGPIRIGSRLIGRAQLVYPSGKAAPSDAHTMLLRPVATPVMVNGLGADAMQALAKLLEPYGLAPMAGGGKSPVKMAGMPKPGDAIGVQLVGGDIDLTAVGTVTYINGGRILAMGHPFLGTGPIDLPIVNAYVHGILSSQDFSFKLASGGQAIIGRWTQDRPWSLGGVLGEKPQTFPGSLSVWDRERGLRKNYSVTICRHRLYTPVLAALSAESAIASIAPAEEGTLKTELEVAAQGLPVLKRKNLYSRPTGAGGDLFAALFGGGGASSPGAELASLLDTLENNPFGSVAPERISLRAEWLKPRLAARIEEASARVKRVRPGDKVLIDLLIQPWGKPEERRAVEVEIPQNAPPGPLRVGIAGGLSARMMKARLQILDPSPTNLAQEWEILSKEEKNDDLVVEMALETSGIELKGKQLFNLPPVTTEVIQSANITGLRVIRDHQGRRMDMPYVLSGGEVLTFLVETDEKEKGGRGPTVSFPGGELGLPGGLLRGLLESEGEGETATRTQVGAAGDDSDKGGEEASSETPPEMPSWEEVEELESQQPETASAEKTPEKPKGKVILRGPGIWEETAEKDFSKGKSFGTAINSSGAVDLSSAVKTLYSAQEGLVWAEAVDANGNLYVGSWMDGKVTRLSPSGEVSVALTTPDTAILSLAPDASGNLYAASAPSGTIYKISPDGKSSEFCRLPAAYAWALLSKGDALFAATGPEGKLFRVSPDGKAELVFQAPDRHLIALASAPDGTIYFATYPKGKVYRMKADKIEPFYETVAGVTALSLAVDSAGNLFVGTSPSGRIIRVDPQGRSRLVWKSAERHIFALWPAPEGSVYAATGPRARIYRVLPDGNAAMLWEAKSGHVVALAESAGNLNASVAGARQVILLDLNGGGEGTFLSSAFDATGPSNWGRIRWQADLPDTSSVALQTRSGSTAFPDSTWSDWSAAYISPSGEKIVSPVARYLQYRAILRSAGPGRPSLRQVDVFYQTLNRPPELKLLSPLQSPTWSGKKSIKWSATDPDKDTLTYQSFYSADQGKTWVEIKEPEKKVEVKEKGKPKAPEAPGVPEEILKQEKAAAMEETESVAVEEEDQVTVTDKKKGAAVEEAEGAAAAAPKGKAEEKPAPAPPIKATAMSWDTSKVPDGVYLVKVVASDRQSSPKEALSDERISEPLQIDNTPPLIVLDKTKSEVPPPSKVEVVDGGSYVASAEYCVDKGEWKGAYCEDGIYDSQSEMVLIDPADLPTGEHVLQVRARDGVGNEATNEVKYKR